MLAGEPPAKSSIHRHLVQAASRSREVLPPVRELASQLAVNRNTVAAAYKRLVTSGLAVSQGRNRYRRSSAAHCRRWREVTNAPR